MVRYRHHYQRNGMNRIGALGSSESDQRVIPFTELKITDVGATYDGYHVTELMRDGKWVVKSFPAQSERDVTLHVTLRGTGTGLLYGTTLWTDERQYLFIKRVQSGIATVTFRVPAEELESFTLGTSKQVNANYGTKLLTRRDVRQVANKLLITNEVKSFETDGLGSIPARPVAPTSENQIVEGGKERHSGIAPKYWDGNPKTHSWETHDYSGDSSPNTGSLFRPKEKTDWTGTSAMRMSTYVA